MPTHATPKQDWIARLTQFFREEYLSLAIWLAVTLLKLRMESAHFMQFARDQAFVALHQNLSVEPREKLPVAIIDISSLRKVRDANDNAPKADYTSSLEHYPIGTLSNIVYRVARAHPTAIGIDIDFSPDISPPLPAPDGKYPFLKYCAEVTDASNVHIPVFVGVHRTALYPPRTWLGDLSLTNLAAWIDIYNGTPSIRMAASLSNEEDSSKLMSMGMALAEVHARYFKAEVGEIAKYFRGIFAEEFEKENYLSGTNEVYALNFYANYNYLPRLRDARCLVPAQSVLGPGIEQEVDSNEQNLSELLRNKVVLIGSAQIIDNDAISVPREPRPVAGVFAHACAVCTLINDPLAKMNHTAGITLSLAVLLGMLILKTRFQQHQSKLEVLLPYLGTIVVIFIAFLFCVWLKVLWLDWVAVALALFLERDIHWFFSHRIHARHQERKI